MTRKKQAALLIVLPVIVLAFVFGALAHKEERAECSLCGMWIDLYMKTRHVVTRTDGTAESFCSIACASKYMKTHKGQVKMVLAADFETKELIEADSAFYIEGSDIHGVMSYTSRLAFTTRDQAERFRKEHGGDIISFKKALESIEKESV
jgi:nitrous oxide reductase accessory protein NosL